MVAKAVDARVRVLETQRLVRVAVVQELVRAEAVAVALAVVDVALGCFQARIPFV